MDSKLHITQWDRNKDGFVTLEEFQLGQKNCKGLEATFKSYDKNGDGKLSREESLGRNYFPTEPPRFQGLEKQETETANDWK